MTQPPTWTLYLNAQFSARFVDVPKYKSDFKLFAAPFDVLVDDAGELVQMELVDLQCNELLRAKICDCVDDIITCIRSIFQNSNFQKFANMLKNSAAYLAAHSLWEKNKKNEVY